MRVTELDLAREDIDVLREVVNQHDGRGVTAGEVRRMIGWAGENHHVTYRFDNLEEVGYIVTEKDPERGPSNQLPPRVARPTEAGVELIDAVDYTPEDRALEERVERLEKQVGKMAKTYGEVKQRIVALEEELEEYDEDLEEVVNELRAVQGIVESGKDEFVFE